MKTAFLNSRAISGYITRLTCSVSMLALGATAVVAGPLEEELAFLLSTHPQLDIGRDNVTAAESGVDAALSGFLPKVTVNGDLGWEYTDNDTQTDTYDTDRYSAGVEIRQNLFEGNKTTANIEAAETTKALADIDLLFRQQQLMFEGIVAYLNVERFGFLKLLSEENEKTLKRQLQLEDERVERGAGIEVDVLQAKSRLQRAVERRVAVEGSLKESHARYLQVFGKPADDGGVFEAVPPVDKLPASLDDALTRAKEKNLQLLNSKEQVKIADAQRRVFKADYAPTLDAVARYDWEQDIDGTEGREDAFFAGLELRWEVFSGFLTDAQVEQASARHNAALSSVRYTTQKVEEEVRVAWRALKTAQEREQLLENAVNIAAEVFIARQKLREGGKETALNVLDAENEFYAARIAQVSAAYEARTAVYRVLLSIGELTAENLGVSS
ncbi:TolC family outer membrane protein [Sneathiella sp. P13V-1]|uniref:TolC family outer membrane protein n=1 Tax=Sneathiella sp. P13V-1 TaxID=2697366 RepID=UPI00187B30A4|nr:TolC family outer membrane protein [Sneathiella sp. P13V-1]MBE7636622.1 TolC family outer membrane protein [Sneathiella sp. P13V-1]